MGGGVNGKPLFHDNMQSIVLYVDTSIDWKTLYLARTVFYLCQSFHTYIEPIRLQLFFFIIMHQFSYKYVTSHTEKK